jgi:hypothetical protein
LESQELDLFNSVYRIKIGPFLVEIFHNMSQPYFLNIPCFAFCLYIDLLPTSLYAACTLGAKEDVLNWLKSSGFASLMETILGDEKIYFSQNILK